MFDPERYYKYNDLEHFVVPGLPKVGDYIILDYNNPWYDERTYYAWISSVPFIAWTSIYGSHYNIGLRIEQPVPRLFEYKKSVGKWVEVPVPFNSSVQNGVTYFVINVGESAIWANHNIYWDEAATWVEGGTVKELADAPPVEVSTILSFGWSEDNGNSFHSNDQIIVYNGWSTSLKPTVIATNPNGSLKIEWYENGKLVETDSSTAEIATEDFWCFRNKQNEDGTITPVITSGTYTYHCVVTHTLGEETRTLTSRTLTLNVVADPSGGGNSGGDGGGSSGGSSGGGSGEGGESGGGDTGGDTETAATPIFIKNLPYPNVFTYLLGEVGDTFTVEASVSDGGTLTYQWCVIENNTKLIIEGATSNSYTPPVDKISSKAYFCRVTNTNPSGLIASADSTEVIINVIPHSFQLGIAVGLGLKGWYKV